MCKEQSLSTESIGLEVIDDAEIQNNLKCSTPPMNDYEENEIRCKSVDLETIIPLPALPPPLPLMNSLPTSSHDKLKRTLPVSNFLLEAGALLIIFILCMILVLAIRENETDLRIILQIFLTGIYFVSIIWMIWCAFDIIKFRRRWMKLTSTAHDQHEYMSIVERFSHHLSYFPDIHNTGGLFMRIGAGLLCMGSLLLTVIELAKTMETLRTEPIHHRDSLNTYSKSSFIAKTITYIFRFFFHCVQFTFLFRYGNIIIDRYHFIARVGLIHIIMANFCTWFEAIVIETLEEIHKYGNTKLVSAPMQLKSTEKLIFESVNMTTPNHLSIDTINFLETISLTSYSGESNSTHNNATTLLEYIERMESAMGTYLYPCLIEYSLICVTVFYIMWRNVGKSENQPFLHFSDRHIFTVNCSRASYGLLFGGIIFLLTIFTLIPAFILEFSKAVFITHIAELILLLTSLIVVCISFWFTTKLYYDRQAHVDIFDEILILITTVGDFAYSFFWLFASIFIESYTIGIPRGVEIAISLIAIFQTFFQSAFILDTLKRRTKTRNDIRKKPGRELITALLLINLAIWMHDSLSAKKVNVNPLQTAYYDETTWSIIQAFTSPLSIFYRFHSSVCLADIWHEVYHEHRSHQHNHISNRLNQH
ncbi:hypothetical protein I4U23_029901 [Adineta vaga]|nr:hypothetical protein I4U23_029901 [Adineta vaga]